MLAPADGNPGAALPVIFELPKLTMVPLCSCFARRVKSAREGPFFASVTHCDYVAFLLCMGLFSHISDSEGPAGPSECFAGALTGAAQGHP